MTSDMRKSFPLGLSLPEGRENLNMSKITSFCSARHSLAVALDGLLLKNDFPYEKILSSGPLPPRREGESQHEKDHMLLFGDLHVMLIT